MTQTTSKGLSRAAGKQAQILNGARTVFLAEGFDGASMDGIARAAGVSKGTLYSYFSGKEELFTSLVTAYQTNVVEETFQHLHIGASLQQHLQTLAHNYLDIVLQQDNLALLRVVVGASAKFPELGKRFYESGMHAAAGRLALFLQEYAARAGVEIACAKLASTQFFGALRASAVTPTLIASAPAPSEDRRSTIIDHVVNGLLASLSYCDPHCLK